MKCPKCGYLGFETGDRCRNCGYDFSLTPPPSDADLTLNQPNAVEHSLTDFELPGSNRHAERSPAPLDLDRLFGVDANPQSGESELALPPPLASAAALRSESPSDAEPTVAAVATVAREASELPFDEGAPVRPPRPARAPLGVRRTTPDMPRSRPRSSRPVRFDSATEPVADAPILAMEDPVLEAPAAPTFAPSVPSMEPATLPVRLGAFAIDAALLGSVSLGVLVLTLRISGLSFTWADVRILPPVPFIGFLALLSLGYVAAFTVAGGQTIGKMLTGARIIGDDGRPVDVAGGVLRALGCALVPLTIGLSYSPVVLTVDRRALHDRLAGTRVVRA